MGLLFYQFRFLTAPGKNIYIFFLAYEYLRIIELCIVTGVFVGFLDNKFLLLYKHCRRSFFILEFSYLKPHLLIFN